MSKNKDRSKRAGPLFPNLRTELAFFWHSYLSQKLNAYIPISKNNSFET